jgi:hypothetical protein
MHFAPSFNGRTVGSEPINRGSNPWGATTARLKRITHHGPWNRKLTLHELGASSMSPEPEPDSQSWWKTLPGLLTAAAAIITAVTGLIVALHLAGLFDHTSQSAAQVRTQPTEANPTAQTGDPTRTPPQSTNPTTSRPLTLPPNSEVHSGQYIYQLPSARLDPDAPGQLSIHFTVRMTNQDRFDANFWAASFAPPGLRKPPAPDQ